MWRNGDLDVDIFSSLFFLAEDFSAAREPSRDVSYSSYSSRHVVFFFSLSLRFLSSIPSDATTWGFVTREWRGRNADVAQLRYPTVGLAGPHDFCLDGINQNHTLVARIVGPHPN